MSFKHKYTYDEKAKILLEYQAGVHGFRELCRIYGIAQQSLKDWIRLYETFGMEGLKTGSSATHYSRETKLAAVQDYLAHKLPVKEILKKYQIRSDQQSFRQDSSIPEFQNLAWNKVPCAKINPLTEEQVKMFKHLKAKETENRDLFGSAYHDNDYIFKHEDGSLYYPDYPTKAFGKLIKAHPELPQGITFHGLRKSCVSILVHEGYDVKRIQKWVGHADIDTTLKIYAKVKDKEAKQEILNGMNNIIKPKSYAN